MNQIQKQKKSGRTNRKHFKTYDAYERWKAEPEQTRAA